MKRNIDDFKKRNECYRKAHDIANYTATLPLVEGAKIEEQEKLYKVDNPSAFKNQIEVLRDKYKNSLKEEPTRGFNLLLPTIITQEIDYHIRLYKEIATQSIKVKKDSLALVILDPIFEEKEKVSNEIEYLKNKIIKLLNSDTNIFEKVNWIPSNFDSVKQNLLKLLQLEGNTYQVHRVTGNTLRATILNDQMEICHNKITVKQKSGIVFPKTSKITITRQTPRKTRNDKLPTIASFGGYNIKRIID